jgi:hypothetical protein
MNVVFERVENLADGATLPVVQMLAEANVAVVTTIHTAF